MTTPAPPVDPGTPGTSDVLVRVCVGLGLWCAGLTLFAAVVWIRVYRAECEHLAIFHGSSTSVRDCTAILSSGGVLRTRSGFFELLQLVGTVVVPLFVIGSAGFGRKP